MSADCLDVPPRRLRFTKVTMIRSDENSVRAILRLAGRAPRAAGLAALLALGGCTSSATLETFDLSLPSGAARQGSGGRTLVVAEPIALQALESDRIVVRAADESITFISGVQWSDRLPRLLQSRIVQSFENAGRAVGRTGGGLTADLALQTEIRFFGLSTATGSPQALIEISAKVVNAEGRIAQSRVFRGTAPVASVDGRSAATALDQAMTRILADIVRWAGRG